MQFIALLVALFYLSPAAFAETSVHSTLTEARLVSDVTSITPGRTFWIALHLKPQKGWHTYWQNPGDSGVPASIEWSAPPGFTVGDIHWPAPRRLPYADLINFGYDDAIYLPVPITAPLALDSISTFTARASWLICKDICVPESATLTLPFPKSQGEIAVSSDAAAISSTLEQLPSSNPMGLRFKADKKALSLFFTLPVDVKTPVTAIEFYPSASDIISNNAPQKFSLQGTNVTLLLKRNGQPVPSAVEGLISIYSGSPGKSVRQNYWAMAGGNKVAASPTLSHSELSSSILHVLLLAFAGGLILNIMPCVLPILSLKALALSRKAAHAPAAVRKQGIAYTLGVLSCFSVLSLVLIALQRAGHVVGWGYHMQSPEFVTFLAYLMFTVGLSLSGFFNLPVLLGNVGNSATSEEGTSSSFLTGMLAVLVATPCTAPFMASAIGIAFTLSSPLTFLVFLALGLGLSFPYLLISFSPSLRRFIPKPGLWMERFKECLAFPMYATAAWLVWVLAHQTGINGVFIVLMGGVWIAFCLWFGRRLGKWTRLLLALLCVTLLALELPTRLSTETSQEKNIFSPAKLAQLRAEHKPVFVTVTAAWCITCKFNERTALSTPAFQEKLKQNDIHYLVADWTNKDDVITRYLSEFNRRGVPLYVAYPPQGDPLVLPSVISETEALAALDEITAAGNQ